MSTQFIGLPISAELSNGTIVEGIIHHIDQNNGKLNLAQARFIRFDGTLSEMNDNFVVDKDSVKDLILLSTRPASNFNNLINKPNLQSNHGGVIFKDDLSSPSFTSKSKQNSQTIQHDTPPSDQLNSHPPIHSASSQTAEPVLDDMSNQDNLIQSVSSNVSLKLNKLTESFHTLAPTQPQTRSNSTHLPKRRSKKSHQTINGTSTLNEPSTAADSGFSAHEDTDGIPTPEPLSAITNQSESVSNSSQLADFSRDFDFQAGLLAFDKAKLWAEIALSDSTDPNERLVAYNRKKLNVTHSVRSAPKGQKSIQNRNLGPTEMVLSPQERAINGSVISKSCTHDNKSRSKPFILSSDHLPIYPVTLDRLNQAFTSASVEYGPNLVQRIENAGRTMSDYVVQLLRRLHPASYSTQKAKIFILVDGRGLKGSCAIRTGSLLANKGFDPTLVLGSNCGNTAISTISKATRSQAFEFQLRLFTSSGSKVITDLQDLPSSPSLIIEALAENSTISLSSYNAIDMRLIEYTRRAPTICIDLPSYVNYDTGEPLTGPKFIPSCQYSVCLAALPLGMLRYKNVPLEICLVDLTLPDSCWKVHKEDQEHTNGDSTSHVDSIPSAWGDKWYTILKL
ncbi:hypothetical protein O181_031812 [Austropuccinia psidii MF-1]|uniref:Enhancer of mRNA-decapping protein 3 n=1 Tax=Austropuccinia psidii MF-1 TaxID=1389203 RepID=A0A9Q3CYC8_9BASI|nr:hypothetical protein [Austropuccinia psidii MF-1]